MKKNRIEILSNVAPPLHNVNEVIARHRAMYTNLISEFMNAEKLSAIARKERMRLISTIGNLGKYAKRALPKLRRIALDPDEKVRERVAEAVRKIEEGIALA